jgi:hypothetical protein
MRGLHRRPPGVVSLLPPWHRTRRWYFCQKLNQKEVRAIKDESLFRRLLREPFLAPKTWALPPPRPHRSLDWRRWCCCCSCWDRDSIVVNYFDRKPFRKESVCFRGSLCDVPCCCCLNADPKLEVRKGGCMICCMHVQENECCCLKDEVVVTPSQDLPLPCCCFANRHGWCTNFCGCCGQPDGK